MYIFSLDNQIDRFRNYLLVMEYADGGSLQTYLRNNFSEDFYNWNLKYNLALQLASAVLCLHDDGIVHRDLVILYEYSLNSSPCKKFLYCV